MAALGVVLHYVAGLLAQKRRYLLSSISWHDMQEMRSRFAEAQQRQSEVLRMAQDGRLDAGVCPSPTPSICSAVFCCALAVPVCFG